MRGGIYINNLYYNINTKDYKIKAYIEEFIDVLEEYYYLKYIEIPYIFKVYAESIGKELHCNFKLITEFLEIRESIEILINELYKSTLENYKRLESKNNLCDFKKNLKEYEDSLNNIINSSRIDLKGYINKEEVRKIYKKLIFMYHPIIRKDKIELWKEIFKAYRELDIDTLERIYFLGKDFGYEYENLKCETLDIYKDRLNKEIKELKLTFPLLLKDIILDDKFRYDITNNIHMNNIKFKSEINSLKKELNILKHLKKFYKT